jgi:Fe-S-cluster-containing dehydrogenase component
MVRYGMVIDLKRCLGCDTCTMACKAANATTRGILWNRVLKYETGKYPHVRLNYLPVLCMHCKEPECEKVCPTGATSKREDGIVAVDNEKCVGCRYCMLACVYASRSFYEEVRTFYPGHMTRFEQTGYDRHRLGTVEKCDFCSERVQAGQEPSCVVSCTGHARYFGNLDDPNSEVSRLIKERRGLVLNPEMNTDPSVYYLPSESGGRD